MAAAPHERGLLPDGVRVQPRMQLKDLRGHGATNGCGARRLVTRPGPLRTGWPQQSVWGSSGAHGARLWRHQVPAEPHTGGVPGSWQPAPPRVLSLLRPHLDCHLSPAEPAQVDHSMGPSTQLHKGVVRPRQELQWEQAERGLGTGWAGHGRRQAAALRRGAQRPNQQTAGWPWSVAHDLDPPNPGPCVTSRRQRRQPPHLKSLWLQPQPPCLQPPLPAGQLPIPGAGRRGRQRPLKWHAADVSWCNGVRCPLPQRRQLGCRPG